MSASPFFHAEYSNEVRKQVYNESLIYRTTPLYASKVRGNNNLRADQGIVSDHLGALVDLQFADLSFFSCLHSVGVLRRPRSLTGLPSICLAISGHAHLARYEYDDVEHSRWVSTAVASLRPSERFDRCGTVWLSAGECWRAPAR